MFRYRGCQKWIQSLAIAVIVALTSSAVWATCTTGWVAPSDDDGHDSFDWTNGSGGRVAYDGQWASTTLNGDEHEFDDYGFTLGGTIPVTAVITGFEVRIRGYSEGSVGSVQVALSWNGGSTIDRQAGTSPWAISLPIGASNEAWGSVSIDNPPFSHTFTPVDVCGGNNTFTVWVKANVGGTAIYVDAVEVRVTYYDELSAPGNPNNPTVSSSTHTTGTWYNASTLPDSMVTIDWTSATDRPTCDSGIDGYRVYWDTSSTTTLGASGSYYFDESATHTQEFAQGSGAYWFHIRSVDNVGNLADATAHLGPFQYDDTWPTNPNVTSSRATWTWINSADVPISVSGASDSPSGVDGFAVAWTHSATWTPDEVKDREETWSGETFTMPADGIWYFHLATVDNAANWTASSVYETAGWFGVDTNAPSDPAVTSPTHAEGVLSNNPNVQIGVSGASDPVHGELSYETSSGVDGFSVAWDHNAVTVPDATKDQEQNWTGTTYDLADGTWYFHLRTVDNADNWTSTEDYGPITIDTESPTVVSVVASDTLITDADTPGNATFTITVDFSEAMNTSVAPTVSFNLVVASTLTLDGTSGWSDVDTYVARYDVADGNVDVNDVAVDVSGAQDAAGNEQEDYAPQNEFGIDTLAPGKPNVPDLDASSDNGESDSDDVTNDDTPTFSGAAGSVEGSSTVELFRAGTISLGTTSAAGDGSWSITSALIPDGTYDITITATDAAGNESPSSDALAVLIDTTPPTTPTGLTPADGTYTNDTTPILSWVAASDPGGSGLRTSATYRYVVVGGSSGYTANLQYQPTLSEGEYVWRIRARDVAGNNGEYIADRTLRIDTTDPTDPTLGSTSHTVNVPSNDVTVDITAVNAADPISNGVSSGVDGFEVAWDQNETWSPSQTANRAAGWTGDTFEATSDGSWWFHIATADAVGNWTSTEHLGPFDIDTRRPVATVVTDHTMIAGGSPIYEGSLELIVTVTYDEDMDQTTPPTISLLNAGGHWTGPTGGAWSSATVYVATFEHNGTQEEILGSAFARVSDTSGATDLAGNADLGDDSPAFDIDTERPLVVSVTPVELTDADAGTVAVSIEYNEPMDTAINPSPTLRDLDTDPYTISGAIWSGDHRTWTGTFTFIDDDEEALGTYRVFGFLDVAGNLLPWTTSYTVDVDTRNPQATVTTNQTTISGGSPIYEGDLVMTVTVSYDEDMDTSTTPTITLEDETAARWTGPTAGSWGATTDTYTATFTHDGVEEPTLPTTKITAFARVSSTSGATDLAGNADVGDDSPGFDIDTRKPRATVTTDHTTIAEAFGDPAEDPIYEGSLVLTVTVTYDEDMDQGATPTIDLVGHTPARWAGPDPADATGWQDARTYVTTFTHDGEEDEVAGVRARVANSSGATDLAGNEEVGDTSDGFDVDTRKPTITWIDAEEGACYVLGSVASPGEFDITLNFSESVWQPGGDELVVTLDLDSADWPGASASSDANTLTFTGIVADHTSATSVWQPQSETRTNVVEDGDNSCDLALTNIALMGNLYDAAGNAFVVPTPLGGEHTIHENQDVRVDTTKPLINDLQFNTDDSYSVEQTDPYLVDECGLVIVYFSANVTDNCCVVPDDVYVDVTLPTRDALLEEVVVDRTPAAQGRVDIQGHAVVRCLDGPEMARVQVDIEAWDCCGNEAIPVQTGEDEGLVDDIIVPIPRDDPRKDMAWDESAIIDPLVEVRLDEFGTYRLVLRESTPVRIDIMANDADNLSHNVAHPFGPCIACGTCGGQTRCCAGLYVHEIVEHPDHGTVKVEGGVGACRGGSVIRYAPDRGYTGPDEFTYRIRDAFGNVSSVIATVYLQVVPEVWMEDVFAIACAGETVEFTVSAADLFIDPDDPSVIPFAFAVTDGPEHGIVGGDLLDVFYTPASQVTDPQFGVQVTSLDFSEAAEVTLTYTPADEFVGMDTIRVRFSDPFGGVAYAVVNITVGDCGHVAGGSILHVTQGEVLALIVPISFKSIFDAGWEDVVLTSLEDGAVYVGPIALEWSEQVNRYVLAISTASLPVGSYDLVIPLGTGETVTLKIEVGEAR